MHIVAWCFEKLAMLSPLGFGVLPSGRVMMTLCEISGRVNSASNTLAVPNNELTPGMILDGTVRNVIDFGAFVDIGVHQDGLVHISQISDKYIKHPSEVLAVGDVVKVTVLSVDLRKKRIGLTMKGMK